MTSARGCPQAGGPHWRDAAAVPILAGVGFTVSLPPGGLAFGDDPGRAAAVTTGVLVASPSPRFRRRSCSGCACANTSARRMMLTPALDRRSL
ncbi:Na+/H+ antiporter NhaA [Planobispora takensis]|nr:Na+/H+ antiporter NhaA [Planobispora takensis]